jgi:nitrite reductase/ring-hydroxylating ferredoxin subunit
MNTDQSNPETLEKSVDRREALRILGCFACTAVVPAVLSSCGLNSLIKGNPADTGTAGGGSGTAGAGTQLAAATDLTTDGQYKLVNLAGSAAVVYASATQTSGSVKRGSVYLVAFSRACTHKGTVIDAPVNGIMNCSNHGQDFDAGTGKPTGTANKTSVGLKQYPLEVRADGTVWAV